MKDDIFLIQDQAMTTLPPRPMREGLFGETLEAALQRLLQEHPEVIPGAQIRPGAEEPPRFLLVRREAPMGPWSLDHLFVDQHGTPTLVECKLIQNPESRRDVIGQIIEYAANAATVWADGKLRTAAHDFWSSQGDDLATAIRQRFEIDDEDYFWQLVEDNLESGRLRLIIAADEIRPEVRRMIEYLNWEMGRVEVLGLEIKCYGQTEGQVVLVPTIVGQLQERADERSSATAGRQRWDSTALREAYANFEDRGWADVAMALLDWAEQEARLLISTTQHPTFGVTGSSGRRIASVYTSDGVWVYFENLDEAERSSYIAELRKQGFVDREIRPEQAWIKLIDVTSETVDTLVAIFKSI